MAQSDGIGALRRATARAARRARGRAVFARIALLMPIPLGYAVLALTAIKLLRLSVPEQRPLWLLGLAPGAVFLFGVARSLFRAEPPWRASLALDQFHSLNDRVTTALVFADIPEPERTPLMQAAIEDGVALSRRLDPKRAVPVTWPRETLPVLLLALGLCVLSRFEVRRHHDLPPRSSFEPMLMSPDDIELFRDVAKELREKSEDPKALVAVRRFNQLLEDIADHRLDRQQVFQRMAELERDLKDDLDGDRDARDEGLKGLARELEKSGLTKPAANALDEKRLADAEKALRELAEKLKKKTERPNVAELQKLRQALERSAEQSAARLKNIAERRTELEQEQKSLLKKKGTEPDAGESPDSKREDNQRHLEHLDRERDRAEQSHKQLSELDRELAQAARDLMNDAGQSARDLEQGAQDINRMAKQEASEEQKKELLRRLQEMRELMRQQGKGGKEQQQRLQQFAKRARGQGDTSEGQEGSQNGQKKDGPLRLGNGSGGPSVEIPMPRAVSREQPGAPGDKPGGGDSGSGQQAGTGHDPNLAGAATDLKVKPIEVSAAGVDTGQGTASSQVIYGAAERGFVGRGYKQVFTDYRTVAERALTQDEIPSGYRFYVRRYFQLIRPRD